jgi:hypothetical protein
MTDRWFPTVFGTVCVVALALTGCGAYSSVESTLTPVPPTRTRLQQADFDQSTPWFDVEDKHGEQLRRGVRVSVPVSSSDQENSSNAAFPACSPAFPVVGTEYGVYYLPSDELYNSLWTQLFRSLCFAAEEGAVRAGYQRGPH